MIGLHFDPDEHAYHLAGVRLPSVTGILAGLGLTKNLGFLDPFYRERGRAVHACIAMAFSGEEIDWEFEGAKHVAPRFQRFSRFAEAARLKPIVFETPLASPFYRYAGMLDYFGPFGRYPFAIIDWKGDYVDKGYRLQAAGGYRGLLLEAAERGEIDVDPGEILACPAYLVPLGGESDLPSAQPIPDEDGEAMNIFRCAATVWNWRLANVNGGPQ